MKTTILFAHPWHGSFNKAVLDRVCETLRADGTDHTLIDLHKDGFDPVMSEADLALYERGKSADPTVDRYNAILDETGAIVMIFPIWWYDMPAILRGFFDKVMLRGSAYTEDDRGLHPIRDIGPTLLLTTSSCPTEVLVKDYGDPVHTVFATTFRCIGFRDTIWHNLDGMHYNTEEKRTAYLDALPGRVRAALR